MKQESRICWLDLEMTGLNAHVDKILEVAALVADFDNTITLQPISAVIHYDEAELPVMDAWVNNHHTQSGLLKNVAESQHDLATVENFFYETLKPYCTQGKTFLGGNTIYQDRIFLKKYMPKLDSLFHYRLIDVSTLKELVASWYPHDAYRDFKKNKEHRALSDIKESMAELSYYREHFFKKIMIVGLSLFSACVIEAMPLKKKVEKRLSALKISHTQNSSPIHSPLIDSSPETPSFFESTTVLNLLERDIETFIAEQRDGTRHDYIDMRAFILQCDIDAIRARYRSPADLLRSFHDTYSCNELISSGENGFLKINDLLPYVTKLARLYDEKISSIKDRAQIYRVACLVSQDLSLNENARKKWKQVFEILVSDKCAENYNNFLINFSLTSFLLNSTDDKRLSILIDRFKAVVKE